MKVWCLFTDSGYSETNQLIEIFESKEAAERSANGDNFKVEEWEVTPDSLIESSYN